jgi:CheY-like chemotaxis protein
MKKLLIIDDDPDIRDSLAAILSAQYLIDTAGGSDEALKYLRMKNLPDLILLDVKMSMPQEGFELVRELDAMNTLKRIPVMLITSLEVMTASEATADIVRKTREKYGVNTSNILVLKSLSGEVMVDYKSALDGKSVTISVEGFHSKPIKTEKLIREINHLLGKG